MKKRILLLMVVLMMVSPVGALEWGITPFHYSDTFHYDVASHGWTFSGDFVNVTIKWNSTAVEEGILFAILSPDTKLDHIYIFNSSGTFEIVPQYYFSSNDPIGIVTLNRSYFELWPLDNDGWTGTETRGIHIYIRCIKAKKSVVNDTLQLDYTFDMTINVNGFWYWWLEEPTNEERTEIFPITNPLIFIIGFACTFVPITSAGLIAFKIKTRNNKQR